MDNSPLLTCKSVEIKIEPSKDKDVQKVANDKLDSDVQDSVSDPLLEVKVDTCSSNGKVDSKCEVNYKTI